MVTLNVGSGKWLAAALLASLALNIFLGGIFAGRIFSPAPGGTVATGGAGDERPIRRFLAAFTAGLDDADRRTFVTAFAGREAEMRTAVRAVRAARREALARMHATPFDRHALDDALAALRQKQEALQRALQTAVADAVESLPADARKLVGTPKRRPREERR
jgi:uncharacterized membrane protein